MAHRHKMQARARGGRTEFAKGGTAGPVYSGGAGKVPGEARKATTGPFKKGGVVVGKAFGGAVKGRADKRKRGGAVSKGFAFASGGKVWSGARSGIAGEKGMAQAVMTSSKLHGETHDTTSKTANDGSNYRSGHGDKAEHQYKTGGRVKTAALKDGGKVERARGGACEDKNGKDGDDDEDDSSGYERGGKLQMHYVGGKGKRHKRQDGGPSGWPANESGLADEGE